MNPSQICGRQIDAGHVRIAEVRSPQIGRRQIDVGHVAVPEARPSQIGRGCCWVEGPWEAAAVLIQLWVEGTQPLAGMAAMEGGEPRRFDGWLELLTVVSELIAAAPLGSEDANTGRRADTNESNRKAGRLHHEPPTYGTTLDGDP